MDTAVPLGMIVNELISNSLKYAFPDRENGDIKIKLFREQSGNELNNKEQPAGKGIRYTLVVSDNGAGIPENIDFENPKTLGLQLVNILVDQLDAEIELRRGEGTEYRISFSNAEK
ncbi:Blue-light-activated histidine kinase 2 [bioreactor metagenome]|uniref:Blue-light-activated histidine kinase 2 n=1 Tax=bioreactor metagenome TaxID=1076179 RepID=A0A645H8L4_9ZZZZ